MYVARVYWHTFVSLAIASFIIRSKISSSTNPVTQIKQNKHDIHITL